MSERYCDWPGCIEYRKPGYAYCPEHVKKHHEIQHLPEEQFRLYMEQRLKELEDKIKELESATCTCQDCIARRSY